MGHSKLAVTLDGVVNGRKYLLRVRGSDGKEREGLVKAEVTPQIIEVQPRRVMFVIAEEPGGLPPGPVGEIVSITEA